MGNCDGKNIKVIWLDEFINTEENLDYLSSLKSYFSKSEGYTSLNDGLSNLYLNNDNNNENFEIIMVIVSGRLFGRYVKQIKKNINKIINIPYTYIFTSTNFKNILTGSKPDIEQVMSYDTMVSINHGFYNPGGVFDDFDALLNEMKNLSVKIASNFNITPRIKDKINYEGLLTFEYLNSEEDLLAPALYRDIICNEKITKDEYNIFHNYILTFDEKELKSLIKNLCLFKNIPLEILSKYWARCYTIESDFYKILNNHLMKSQLSQNYKTFIKVLYKGIDINSLKSYNGQYLYRGSVLNIIEVEKIMKYKNKGKLSNIVVFSKAFLSFSEEREKAEGFIGISDNTKIGCLYILENNNANLHESNADIHQFSKFPEEKEILFFPGSSFIIKNIKNFNNKKIEITLNYNGKFKENYSLIYENQNKLKDLLKNNTLTKELKYDNLWFLKKGRYLVGEQIGRGGFSTVFKGKDMETGEIVAIKKIDKRCDIINYIKVEIKMMKFISEKIKYSCKFKDYFETNNSFYIISSCYDDDLNNYLMKKEYLPPNLINKIFKQLNETFKELLDNNIVHRDIKPGNILIKYDDNDEKKNFDSILTDYGKSKIQNDKNNLIQTYLGTPEFMAPEIFELGGYKNTCDLYSIGITIYLLYLGKDSLEKYGIHDNFDPKIIPKAKEDKDLDDLLKKLLKEKPNERISWQDYFDHPFFKKYQY